MSTNLTRVSARVSARMPWARDACGHEGNYCVRMDVVEMGCAET